MTNILSNAEPEDPNSLFGRFARKAGRAMPAWKPKVRREFTRQIIKTTSWDEFDWKAVRRDKDINNAITDLYLGDLKNPEDRPGYLNAPELVQDIFMTFLKPVPMLYKKHEVKRDARLNGKFVEQLMALTDWERLHDQTATDAMLAKMATTVVIEALQEMIKQHREAVKQANEERQKGSDRIPDKDRPPSNGGDSWDEESGQGRGTGEGGGGEGNAEGGPGSKTDGKGESQLKDDEEQAEQPEGEETEPEVPWDNEREMRESIKKELEEAKKKADQQGASQGEFGKSDATGEHGEDGEDEGDLPEDEEANLDELDRELGDDWMEQEFEDETDWERMFGDVDFGRHVNGALQKAADDIQELDELRKGVGIDDADWKMMDPTERLKIAEKLNTPRMKQIADMVGRMKRFALSKQAQKIIDAPHEIFDVEMGNDLRRVLRSEFAFLGTPETKPYFYLKYINHELLCYKERGHEDVGKGPMIVCIDNSGSMSGAPENWAKGVAEAMRRVCADQRRDFEAIYFETNRHRERFNFPMGQGPFEKVLTFLSVSAGGGTEFDGILTEALAKCQAQFDSTGAGKADIVFITDGEASLNQAWIDQFVEERDRIGARIFGIYISAYDSSRNSATKLLEKFCQIVVPVKALEVNDESSSLLFETL